MIDLPSFHHFVYHRTLGASLIKKGSLYERLDFLAHRPIDKEKHGGPSKETYLKY